MPSHISIRSEHRKQLRNAYACPCRGYDAGRSIDGDRGELALSVMFKRVTKWTGGKALTCPYWAFYEPLIGDVMNVMPSQEMGIALDKDIPAPLYDAAIAYMRFQSKAREAVRKANEKQGKRDGEERQQKTKVNYVTRTPNR